MSRIGSHAVLFAFFHAVGACAMPIDDSATAGSVSLPVIYGHDDRVEAYQAPDPAARSVALGSSVALVFAHRLRLGEAHVINEHLTTLEQKEDLCPGKPFAEQPALADCSGVLIDDDLVLTAGHCFGPSSDEAKRRCREFAVLFGYAYDESGALDVTIGQVRLCRQLVAHQFVEGDGTAPDFAVFQLNAPAPPGRTPATVTSRNVVAGEPVYLIGNGAGLPTKVDAGGRVLEEQTDAEFFRATTDSFAGGSGSAVFDADLAVLGVQSRGNPDYRYTGECNEPVVLSSGADLHQKASSALDAVCGAGWPSSRLCQHDSYCGDGACTSGETLASCPIDCHEPACGDGTCDIDEWTNCDADCGRIRNTPPEWWCPSHRYGDGAHCDCECGAFDPDCSLHWAQDNCGSGWACGASGRCELAGLGQDAGAMATPVSNPPGCSIRRPDAKSWRFMLCWLLVHGGFGLARMGVAQRKLRRWLSVRSTRSLLVAPLSVCAPPAPESSQC